MWPRALAGGGAGALALVPSRGSRSRARCICRAPSPMGRGGEQQQSSKFFFTEGPLPGLSGTQEVFAGGLLGLICGYYFVLIPALLGVAAYAWLARSTIVAAGLVAFVSSAAWPARTAVAPTPVTKSWLWLWWCRYFTLETVVEEPLDAANRPHIFASFPHGMFPIGPYVASPPREPRAQFRARKLYLTVSPHLTRWVSLSRQVALPRRRFSRVARSADVWRARFSPPAHALAASPVLLARASRGRFQVDQTYHHARARVVSDHCRGHRRDVHG